MISRFVLRLYDKMSSRRGLLFFLLLTLTAGLVLSALRQTYKEDISDFLPLNSRQGDAMKVYQEISGAQRIFAVFGCNDSTRTEPDSITAALPTRPTMPPMRMLFTANFFSRPRSRYHDEMAATNIAPVM